jgi:hypothetical protein
LPSPINNGQKGKFAGNGSCEYQCQQEAAGNEHNPQYLEGVGIEHFQQIFVVVLRLSLPWIVQVHFFHIGHQPAGAHARLGKGCHDDKKEDEKDAGAPH